MTSQSPRIYIYKITFEEVPYYYYYGVHKEKYFNEEYWGSPITHKWCWDFYTPKKQILQLFDFTDEGWLEAQKVEKRLIRPFYNTDVWCLNENCGGIFSINHQIRAGIIAGNKTKELGIGIFGMPEEERKKARSKGLKKVGKDNKQLKRGIFAFTKEEIIETAIKGGNRCKELGLGIHALTFEERSKNAKITGFCEETAKKYGKENVELKRGVFGMTDEELYYSRKRGGEVSGKKTSSQRWMCEETGYISTPGGLSAYQKARNIDTSKRKRIK